MNDVRIYLFGRFCAECSGQLMTGLNAGGKFQELFVICCSIAVTLSLAKRWPNLVEQCTGLSVKEGTCANCCGSETPRRTRTLPPPPIASYSSNQRGCTSIPGSSCGFTSPRLSWPAIAREGWTAARRLSSPSIA